MKFKNSTILGVMAVFISIAASCRADGAVSTIRDGDRIVFVGDSITGQGGNSAQGWTGLMSEALSLTHPTTAPKLIALGGSGQTVGSWQGIEKRSREQSVILDVKGIDVKATLDQPADIVVIMLGMNDVLSPSLNGEDADFDKWAQQFKSLVASLRERVKPRLFAFATVPLCTEDEKSPKNLAIGELTERLNALANEEKAVVLPVHQSMLETLAQGRTYRPDFHVTSDFVHPTSAGHLAIAQGMLKGLGEAKASQILFDKYALKMWGLSSEQLPALSYTVEYLSTPIASDTQTITLRYWWTDSLPNQPSVTPAPKIRLTVPKGWKSKFLATSASKGEYTISGPFDRLRNQLTLEATSGYITRKIEVSLPTPWLMGTGKLRQMIWLEGNGHFDPQKGHLAIDDTLVSGKGWGKPIDIAAGHPMIWKRYNPSVNYLGGASSGSVDMSAVTFFDSFEVGYGAKWIYSDRERSVQFKVGSQSFGGNDFLGVWMNGESIYSGHIMKERGKIVDAKLHKGWNALVVKSNHLQWQWHFSVELVETEADDLSDLRFSAVPHPA